MSQGILAEALARLESTSRHFHWLTNRDKPSIEPLTVRADIKLYPTSVLGLPRGTRYYIGLSALAGRSRCFFGMGGPTNSHSQRGAR
ncbi:hypothetical protein SUGI_0088600 [Cryptomeria japonica]|nr:hypothetical protein SUGI_0088600 [Cryptomeria japonica]